MVDGLYAVAGLVLGAVLSWWWHVHRQRDWIRSVHAKLTNAATLPAASKEKPVPRSLSELEAWLSVVCRQFGDQLRQLSQRQGELDAILASMVEGVVAVDNDGRVFTMNRAASEMLAVDSSQAQGRPLLEVVRHPGLLQLVESVLTERCSQESELTLHGDRELTVRAQAAALAAPDATILGAVVVLEDITRLKRLEEVRREFVANVSHEIKTPMTSIQGYLETLVEGDVHDPEDVRRFLKIAVKQSRRLGAIVDDLLALAHLEEQEESQSVRLSPHPLRPVLEDAIEWARSLAGQRGITLKLDCSDDLVAPINAPLLEQALTNLLDNACKYSESDTQVRVVAKRYGAEVWIDVIDQGCGIESRHLPRLFERFYRVDRSRSRKLGGTGLGLAIVKHIARVHGGEVTVSSTPGEGSRFTLKLPAEFPPCPPAEPPDTSTDALA
ncbi:MAG TPA: PAS domain-containing protein [Planctomycetaceae bacterium]|nr:PAS domain-containing protein [Planctomycetaceae bacterium]